MSESLFEIVSRLEELEAEDAHPSRLLGVLDAVQEPAHLWDIAERVTPYIPIMRMIFRRAHQLGASADRARGYLALAYIFDGDDETASAIVADPQESTDPVLLSAWAHLSDDSGETLTRLQYAMSRCPSDARLRDQTNELLKRLSRGGDS